MATDPKTDRQLLDALRFRALEVWQSSTWITSSESAVDTEALARLRDAMEATAGTSCEFEAESLDGAEFVRLYELGLVAITAGNKRGWPIAAITRTGTLILQALHATAALDTPPNREGVTVEGQLYFSTSDDGQEFTIRGEGVGEAFKQFDMADWDIGAHGPGGSLFAFMPPVRIEITPLGESGGEQ